MTITPVQSSVSPMPSSASSAVNVVKVPGVSDGSFIYVMYNRKTTKISLILPLDNEIPDQLHQLIIFRCNVTFSMHLVKLTN